MLETGKIAAEENTRRLVVEHGGFLYDADNYNDDLPFWTKVEEKPIVRKQLDC